MLAACIFVPFLGLPWLFYEIWQGEKKKREDAYFDKLFEPVTGALEKNFSRSEDYIKEKRKEVDLLENAWRSRGLFEEKRSNVSLDDSTLHVGGQAWWINKYESQCSRISRPAIPELIEEWRVRSRKRYEYYERIKKDYHKKATNIKREITKTLAEGETWIEVLSKYEKNVIRVSLEHSVWKISYHDILELMTEKLFAMQQLPNEISFSLSKKTAKKPSKTSKKTSAKKEENASKSLDICQNCGSKVIGEIGMVRCGKCYHTLGGPNREEPAPLIVNNREIRNNWQGKSR